MKSEQTESQKGGSRFWLFFFFSVDFSTLDPGIVYVLKYVENYTHIGSLVFSKYYELTFPKKCKGSYLCKWKKEIPHMELTGFSHMVFVLHGGFLCD